MLSLELAEFLEVNVFPFYCLAFYIKKLSTLHKSLVESNRSCNVLLLDVGEMEGLTIYNPKNSYNKMLALLFSV